MNKAWNFTVTFARTDEDPARVHVVGFNAWWHVDRASAERAVRAAFDHLVIISIQLNGVLTEDGDIIEEA